MARAQLLFVDDEPNIRVSLSAILEKKGFQVTTAASVPEALELIGKNQYDVLLSDLNIGAPGDGFTVVSAMRRLQPQGATFILTGYPDFESALLAIRNQVDDYFTKPADVDGLVRTIRDRLNGKRSAPPPVRLRRVSELLRENAQSICDRWLEAALNSDDLSRVGVMNHERAGHVAAVLEEMIARLERESEDASPAAAREAEKYGRIRCRQGYTAAQLVLESRLLQRAIVSTVQANLLGVDLSRLIPDIIEIGESLALQLEISVRGFQDECGRPIGAGLGPQA